MSRAFDRRNGCLLFSGCDVQGALCQDSRFVGSDGIMFYFHGRMDRDFCIVSDSNFHINARFIGKRNLNLKWDFTWVQSLGIIPDSQKLFIGAAKTSKWDPEDYCLSIILDGIPIHILKKEGHNWTSLSKPSITITLTSDTNGVSVEHEGKFQINAVVVLITEKESKIRGYDIRDDDCFTHLELEFKFYDLTDAVDGVLGQTYAKGYMSKVRVGATMPVMGGMHKYASSSLFSTDCEVSRFGKVPRRRRRPQGKTRVVRAT